MASKNHQTATTGENMQSITRRQALALTSASFFAGSTMPAVLGQPHSGVLIADNERFEVDEVRTISLQPNKYHGWPTLTRRSDGGLLVVCSGGREAHVCPFGRVEFIRSRDDGETWTFARTLTDGPIDDRDAGIVETAKGTLLVTTFSSLAYVPQLEKAVASQQTDSPTMAPEQLARWRGAHERIADDAGRNSLLGTWMLRSTDAGLSWSPPYRVPVNSPHGPVALSDGRLLYAGVALWEEGRVVGICTSEDDGLTWQRRSDLPVRAGDEATHYHELHAVEAADGRWIVQIRNHNEANKGETLQTHSTDEGRTWAEPYAIGVWGLPSHLLRLSDDRLLMTYGHRRAPLGNQARISEDNGRTWSEAMVLYGEGISGDLGYPSTVETSPGRLLTVWYEVLPDNPFAQLRMAKWRLV